MLPLNNYCPIRSDKKNIVCFSLKAGRSIRDLLGVYKLPFEIFRVNLWQLEYIFLLSSVGARSQITIWKCVLS
jgi:hypothetical protein